MNERTLQQLLAKSFAQHGTRRALEVDGISFTYQDLSHRAAAGAVAIVRTQSDLPFVVVFSYRSEAAFLGILAALLAGKAYLPVSHKFPAQRLAEIFELSRADTLVLGRELTDHFLEFLQSFDDRLPELNVLYLPGDEDALAALRDSFPRHRYLPIPPVIEEPTTEFPESSPDDYAYMLFTSGSTGKPKGIAITHENVCSYLEYICSYFDFHPDDRFSQCFDLTFDYSVHDMFCCWLSGACLCVIPSTSLMAPAKFLQSNGITVWFSVPSLAMTMDRLRMLTPGRFPGIRLSLFGGEAVSRSIVDSWQAAAPNSTIYNVYGPTEATINVTHYLWDPVQSPQECVNEGLPLGQCFPTLDLRIVDAFGREVPAGERGQLVVTGPQIARGYYQNEAKTAQVFRTLPDHPDKIWYFTGDLASRDDLGTVRYFGRIDFQVQICGYRVELAEIEAQLRAAARCEEAVAVPWPFAPQTGRADYLVAVIGGRQRPESETREIERFCRARLPDYAVPADFIYVEDLPLNINGKIDRGAIARILGETLT